MESRFTWLDGTLRPTAEATVPFLTNALHYGTAVFEGIRCYGTDRGPAVFRLQDHLERLLSSARLFGMRELPYGLDELRRATHALITANDFTDCYLRPLIFLSQGGFNLNTDLARIGVGIAAWEWKAYLGPEALAKGIRANVSSYTRHHPNVTLTKAKTSGNYVNSFLAKTESARLGFDEAIQLDPWGFVAECTGENLFLVRQGTIYTPPRATVLEGITRDSLLTIASDLGLRTVEEPISRDQLYLADEVFVCGTAAEVIGLCEIDFRPIGTGATGPITRRLQACYQEAIRGREPRYRGWLDPVRAG